MKITKRIKKGGNCLKLIFRRVLSYLLKKAFTLAETLITLGIIGVVGNDYYSDFND